MSLTHFPEHQEIFNAATEDDPGRLNGPDDQPYFEQDCTDLLREVTYFTERYGWARFFVTLGDVAPKGKPTERL